MSIWYAGSVKLMPDRKLREIDLQPCRWLQLALPGWRLVSLLFLYGVSFTDPVMIIMRRLKSILDLPATMRFASIT